MMLPILIATVVALVLVALQGVAAHLYMRRSAARSRADMAWRQKAHPNHPASWSGS